MVSQSSSVGYTIMGKTADLTVVQKTTIDTLHKEGKTQKVIAKEAGCSQSSVSKHINREAKGRKRCGRKKCTSIGITAPWRGLWNKTHSKMWGRFTRVDCSWSQCFKNHYAQTYARHGFQLSHSLCQATLEQQTASEASRLDCCWVVQSYVLWWKLILHFLWKSGSQSLEEERRGTESMLIEVQCKVSTVSDGLGCHVICWCWSTVFSEVQGQHSRIPGRFRALHASCCWPSLWRCRFHFPTGLGTCTQCQSYQYLV